MQQTKQASPLPLIAVIGVGNMGQSFIRGLLATGYPKQCIIGTVTDEEHARTLSKTLDITIIADNEAACDRADVVVLAVKPYQLQQVLKPLAAVLQQHQCLLMSAVAGITVETIHQWLGLALPVIRCMPNTPAAVGAAASGLFAGPDVTDLQRDIASDIANAIGVSVWVENEEQLDIVTALSGSGPAYFFLVIEALQQAAIDLGLSVDAARLLAEQTAYGAGKLIHASEVDAAALRKRVTSPKGTTAAALAVLEQGNLRELFKSAVDAATQRAAQLADENAAKT